MAHDFHLFVLLGPISFRGAASATHPQLSQSGAAVRMFVPLLDESIERCQLRRHIRKKAKRISAQWGETERDTEGVQLRPRE
jgi:hypothetical protein